MVKRKNFARLKEISQMPHLLDIQYGSYEEFLQKDAPKTKREDIGLEAVFKEVLPIENYDGTYKLEYINYTLGNPKYSAQECRRRALTYAAPLKVKFRLRTPKDTREQEVYFCDLPLMTDTGTFVINGDERVVVSQLHRSPGISFEETMHPNGKRLYSARVIPYRGAWLEFEFDLNDVMHAVLDRRRKFLATEILRAIGLSTNEEILNAFKGIEKVEITKRIQFRNLIGMTLSSDVVDKEGNIIVAKDKELTKDLLDAIWDKGIRSVDIIKPTVADLTKTMQRDHTKSQQEALLDIYRKIRPGDPATIESAQVLVQRFFFDQKRYNLGKVGRYMLNRKLGMNAPLDQRALDTKTIVRVIEALVDLKNGKRAIDDIDHLGNRRIRSVGELLQNQFRIALVRLERATRERMNIYDLENSMPHNLLNTKLIATIVKDFFGRSQLSQFMDQTNPLAEMTHKRRLSALGTGGLSRERAGFEVRDVHYTHYGRMCPIETPEGPNIGLITSLSTYARINEYGFIETPYRKVENGKVTNRIEHLTADVEDQFIVAQANAKLDKENRFTEDRVFSRYKDDFVLADPKEIQYMDVSPIQLVSIAAGLIPFLEHDDANRALMGSNMQRQAVPLMMTQTPLIATGLEYRTAKDSGAVVVAANSGRVSHVQSDEIIVGGKIYKLRKFEKSNANTCINQRPIVKVGDSIDEGDVIADGPATAQGELALGKDVLVAFMPWRGYNFEDAILINEKLVKEDVFTSVHIEEFEIEARDTRLGNEEITRDIPNVSEESLLNLDEGGIVRTGAEVGPGDILVGKVTPKSETELSPEEKLLRAIFGEKAGDVRDSSLTVPPGIEGIVVEVRVFSRKDPRSKTKEEKTKELKQIEEIKSFYQSQIDKITEEKVDKMSKLLLGRELENSLLDEETGVVVIGKGRPLRKKDLKKIDRCDIEDVKFPDDPKAEQDVKKIAKIYEMQIQELSYEMESEIERVKRGDELPPGVLKKVVVYVASKRKVSVGDKLAGRHGNKGVVAKILPEEDMPYMPDGTPIEIVLNPLGVPSRMNVGQLLETHLGWAAKVLGFYVATPVFDGAKEDEIKEEMRKAGLPLDGKLQLRDGLTGEPFDQKITVGYIYMMKLVHMVDDKIHARSIGPYSLVTQQPLGGKAQFGGQRFGEMEVWALEAYGAAFTLQELLTVKSDDVVGRTKIYEAIVKGENALHAGTPESFNVLVKELQGLALDVKLGKESQKEKEQKAK